VDFHAPYLSIRTDLRRKEHAMSYPPPTYNGTTGEVSAVFVSGGKEPELKIGPLTEARYLASGELTRGRFGLYRWDMAPGTPGAAVHYHKTLAESFFIVAGAVEVLDGEKWTEAGPGDYLYVPEGGLHGFRNASSEPASMLILFAPGAPREPYFEGLAAVANGQRQFTPEEYKAFCEAHDNYFV
jgi:mannose-6-phosphate isomerase-like protein (cupin superfamily)